MLPGLYHASSQFERKLSFPKLTLEKKTLMNYGSRQPITLKSELG
jgi:hypothetical protein